MEARKSFRGTVALDGMDLRVAPGEWVGLVGPNGAGKTTLMKAMVGLVELDAGEIRLSAGESLSQSGPRLTTARDLGTHIGFVPQEIALYEKLTVRENLLVFGRLHGLTGGPLRRRVDWAESWTGLSIRSSEPVKRLSGGMRRCLNIACGVLHEPSIVLLDEPTVGVDLAGRRRIQEMLETLRDQSVTVIWSSHMLNELESVCDRLAIVGSGRIRAFGSLDELAATTTLGARRVRVRLASPPSPVWLGPDLLVEGAEIRGTMSEVSVELPRLLDRLAGTGAEILGVNVGPPGLEDLLPHLTECSATRVGGADAEGGPR